MEHLVGAGEPPPAWNIWWVRESLLRLHQNPFFTSYLFYPDGVPLLFHTFSFSLGLASVPLQLALPGGALTAHNVLVVAAPALAVLALALLEDGTFDAYQFVWKGSRAR